MQCKNILIIEDDADISEILKFAIELEGYTVYTAANGQEGLEALSKIEPCLILLDLMMPIMDGWAFAEALEKDPTLNKIPFVVITAFAESAINIKKARGIIKKPVELELLNSTLKKFCA
ncbi:MAG: response regulator [Bacteriovorax sp.]|nr:response regulator [Bacteriovorax sp.]